MTPSNEGLANYCTLFGGIRFNPTMIGYDFSKALFFAALAIKQGTLKQPCMGELQL